MPAPAAPTPTPRRRATRIVVGALVAVLLLAALGFAAIRLYAGQQTGGDVAEPTVAGAATAVTADPADLDGAYAVGDGSEAGYRVDEVLAGKDVTVVGRTSEVTGSATIAGGELTEATIDVDMASIETDESQRDARFQDILGTAEFPTATFELSEPVDVSAVADGETVTVDAAGTMTIQGVPQDVTATLQVRLTEDGAAVSTQVPVTFADYGVTAPDLGFVTVEDDGFVEAELALTR
ncbi:YceI family protein [Isoptericola sp. NPDC057653]|uniref:YceI family protein n=1 Tax=Isoptericola sp. NPDC057653 TaxID=3346195 RepID=UPI0036D0C07E